MKQTRTLGGIDYTVERRYEAAGRVLGVTYPDGNARSLRGGGIVKPLAIGYCGGMTW